MTVRIELGGKSYDVPPFMLAELELAAPHIDRMNELQREFSDAAKAGAAPPMTVMMGLFRAQISILAIGVANVDPSITADTIAKQVNFSFMPSLQTAVNELLLSAGISSQGEAKAPSPKRGRGARASKAR